MTDTYGHTLNSGEKYFWGKYLQKVRPRKSNKNQFQLINRDTVTPDERYLRHLLHLMTGKRWKTMSTFF